MKANELMIGDWVYNHRDWECPIVEIHKNSAVVIARHYGEEEFLLSDLRPIPLTTEILEKNLATEPQIAWCVGWNKKDDIHVEIKGEDLNADFYGVIDYIHQLQHALRLCGIEKQIIL